MRKIKKISLLFASVALLVVTLFSGNNEAKTDDVKVVAADSTVQKTPKKLSLSNKSMAFYDGDAFTLGSSAKLKVTYDDSSIKELEENNPNLSFTIDDKQFNIGDKLIASEHNGKMVKISYTENGTTISATRYTIEVISLITIGEGTWELVNDSSQLTAGDKIILASKDKGKTAGKLDLSGDYFVDVDSAFNSDGTNITSLNSETLIMELSGSIGAWEIKNGDGDLLTPISSSNTVKWDDTTASTWKIDIASNGSATITSTVVTARVIKYSTRVNSTRFTTYDAAYTTAVVLPQIYKFVEKSNDTTTKFIEDWAALRAKGGDAGICYYLTKGTRSELDAMINRYSNFSGEDKNTIDNASDGGTTIGNTIAYVSSLLAKLDSEKASGTAGIIITSTNNYDKTSLIALFAILGIVTISGYYIIEKKKSAR